MPIPTLRFAGDEDMLLFEAKLDDIVPRFDAAGNRLNDWDRFHALAMQELAIKLSARRATSDRFELGRLGLRTKEDLRPAAACFALHFLFEDQETNESSEYFQRKSAIYLRRATGYIDAIAPAMDYDSDNDGDIGEFEKDRPMATAFIRG